MKAMILAAGVGSRLDPLTRTIPKPMVPVVNRPVIEHIVEKLAAHNFKTIKINLHYLGGTIREYLGDGSQLGVEIEYVQEDQLWGDAGSVKRSERFFEDETFLVVGGDDISNINLTAFLEFHRKNGAAASQALSIVDDPSEYGIVLTEPDGRITKFQEKPAPGEAFSNTANTGVYMFEPHVLQTIPQGVQWGFGRNVFPALLEAGEPVYGFITEEYWKDVGNIQVYKNTNFDALAGKVKLNILGTPKSGNVWVGEGSVLAADVEIEERVVIGKNVTIGAGAKLLSDTVIGDGCTIGEGAVLQRTILWNDANVDAGSRLEGCIVGKGATIGTNVAVFNGLIVDPIRKSAK